MGNKNLYMLNAEYNDYDDIEDYFEDYIPDNEEQSKSAIYVPYIPEYINIQDIGLGMEIPVNSIDISYSDKPTVRISDNELLNIKRPNIRTRNTIQKNPQERIDYINKKRTDINPINNIPQKSEEIVMKPKKKETKKIDYQKIADTLYPSMKEKSQIGVTQRYKLLDDTPPKNTKIFYNYEPMTLLGDSNYKAPNLFEKEKLQKENEILKKALEYEDKMRKRAEILYSEMKDKYKEITEKEDNTEYEINPYYKDKHETYKKILIDANTYAGKENIDGYKPYYTDTNPKTGFYGRAYINRKNKTIVIAYKGSDTISKKDWFGNNFPMWLIKKVPKQFSDAEQFYFDVRDKLGNEVRDYKFDFAGYSLGGTLAELMGAKYGNETVTFNSFSASQIKNVVINYSDNIINYGNKNDYIFNMNDANHIGKVLFIKNEIQKEETAKYITKYHYLENIGNLDNVILKKQ